MCILWLFFYSWKDWIHKTLITLHELCESLNSWRVFAFLDSSFNVAACKKNKGCFTKSNTHMIILRVKYSFKSDWNFLSYTFISSLSCYIVYQSSKHRLLSLVLWIQISWDSSEFIHHWGRLCSDTYVEADTERLKAPLVLAAVRMTVLFRRLNVDPHSFKEVGPWDGTPLSSLWSGTFEKE